MDERRSLFLRCHRRDLMIARLRWELLCEQLPPLSRAECACLGL
jgi:hypothetical protein